MSKLAQPNRLINETSPYLLQHAYNPVKWYPWCEEAFRKAKEEDKPIFLSIGYSTCHWCHVMAHEVFEDQEAAEYLNQHFIAIKVDKEQRPDIDSVYMTVCQALTGSGGWPLTIVMTPEQHPFFAGTYFPKTRRYQVPGMMEILKNIIKEWKDNRSSVLDTGAGITMALQKVVSEKPQVKKKAKVEGNSTTNEQIQGEKSDESKESAYQVLIQQAYAQLAQTFDATYGGFGQKPKFPMPHNLMFLMRYAFQERNNHAKNMVEKTLDQMYRGGIFDHVGFGFSRYSTDEKWLAPHFEKMLYDNGLLTIAYLEGFQMMHKPLYKEVAEKTLKYMMREMIGSEGGFYSAQDADCEGGEGTYYLFTKEEIETCLGVTEGVHYCNMYGITEHGNFEEKNIPNLIDNQEYESCADSMEPCINKLYQYRLGRMKLHKDDKILTSWNSLGIIAFAKAYMALDQDEYLKVAEKAMGFLQAHMIGKEGKLYGTYREGTSSGMGTLDDYGFFSWALLELYEATFSLEYLSQAMAMVDLISSNFLDAENGGYFMTDREAEQLIFRPKEVYDGAIPSGNSVVGYVMMKLYRLTGLGKYQEKAKKQLDFLSSLAVEQPMAYCFSLMGFMLDEYEDGFLCENGACSY